MITAGDAGVGVRFYFRTRRRDCFARLGYKRRLIEVKRWLEQRS
jgi:hypothetical protein